jgi:UDP-N-acetylglucosamine 3-dehydrogenase
MKIKNISGAVIGVGAMGRNHARILSELGYLKAVVDADSVKAQEISKQYNCSYYLHYEEMLKMESKLDFVVIATPTTTHEEIAIACMKAGLHVFIEKPISHSVEAGKNILKIAKECKKKVMIGHIERFNPGYIKVKELIQLGVIGNIVTIKCKRVGPFPPRIKDVNVIVDLSIHDLDIAMDLLGKRVKIKAVNGGKALIDKEDYVSIFLTSKGRSAFIETSWIVPIKMRKLEITGDKGYIELDYINQTITVVTRPSTGEISLPETITVEKIEPLKAELQHFCMCVQHRGMKPYVTGKVGLRALKLALKCCKRL